MRQRRARRPARRAASVSWCAGRWWAGCMVLPLLVSCSPDTHQTSQLAAGSTQSNHAPTIRSARIMPVPLMHRVPATVEVDTEDLDGDFVTYQFRWWVNGNLLADVTTQVIAPDVVKKGDVVIVEVVASDGKAESQAYKTEPVQVQNSVPKVVRVGLEFEPQSPGGSRLKAKVEGDDADGDDISYSYRWWRNDTLVKEGPEPTFDATSLARKDAIYVEVIPRDAESEGELLKSTSAVVGNTPPAIVSTPVTADRPGPYQYTVRAEDPDGDPLTYGLETAPPGMTIDKTTGHIEWTVSPELAGTHRVKISADDGQGGVAWQEFEIAIPSAVESAAAQSAAR